MKVGENPFKVRNIVATQLDAFRKLYGGLIKSFWRSVYVVGGKAAEDSSVVRTLRQDRSVRQRGLTASKLPVGARGKVLAYYERKWNLRNALEGVPAHEAEAESTALWEKIVQDDEFVLMLQKSTSSLLLALLGDALTSSRSGTDRCPTDVQPVPQGDTLSRPTTLTRLHRSQAAEEMALKVIEHPLCDLYSHRPPSCAHYRNTSITRLERSLYSSRYIPHVPGPPFICPLISLVIHEP